MNVAIVLMKGFDGCGVSRFAIEHQKELRRTGHICDIYSFERKYSRAKSHKDKDAIFYKDFTSIDFSKYDIFVLNSYEKEFEQKDLDYYRSLSCKKVAMMHEIIKQNYGRIPHLWDWIEASDIVSSFSIEMDFTKELFDRYPKAKYFSFKMAMSDEEINNLYKNSLDTNRNDELIYYGRWTTMKDPHRLIDYKALDPNIDVTAIGIERSMGAFADILSNPLSYCPKCPGFIESKEQFYSIFRDKTKMNVIPPIDRNAALDILRETLYGCSFYRLEGKRMHNLGNRMEFTQIEISSVCLPVFDKIWGENTFDNLTGKSFYDLGDNAIYSDKYDLQSSLDEMRFLKDHIEDYNRRRKNVYDIIKRNFGAQENIKNFYWHVTEDVFEHINNSCDDKKFVFGQVK